MSSVVVKFLRVFADLMWVHILVFHKQIVSRAAQDLGEKEL